MFNSSWWNNFKKCVFIIRDLLKNNLVITVCVLKSNYLSLQCFQSSSVQSLSRVWLFATPWIAARQASLSITNCRSSLRLMSIESVMPSNHLILCRPLLLQSSIFPSIRVFSNESALQIRWPKYWSFSFNISPSNEHPYWSPSEWTGWISLQFKGLSRVFSNTTVQNINSSALSFHYSPTLTSMHLEKP